MSLIMFFKAFTLNNLSFILLLIDFRDFYYLIVR